MSLEIVSEVKQHRVPSISPKKFNKSCVIQPGYRRELFMDTQQVSKLHFSGAARVAKDLSREVNKAKRVLTLIDSLIFGKSSPLLNISRRVASHLRSRSCPAEGRDAAIDEKYQAAFSTCNQQDQQDGNEMAATVYFTHRKNQLSVMLCLDTCTIPINSQDPRGKGCWRVTFTMDGC